MASTDATAISVKNQAYRATFPIWDADGDLVTGATGLDSEVSKDGGTFADCTNEATEIATASGMYFLDLTATEMNADTVAIIVKTSTSGAKTTPLILYPQEAGDIRVNVTYWNGTAVATPDTAGYPKVTIKDGTGTGEIDTSAGGVLVSSLASGAIIAGSFGAGAIDAAAIATDAIGSAEISAAAVTKIQAGLSTYAGGAVASVTGNVGGNVTGSVGSVVAGVTVTTNNDKTGYALSGAAVQAIWDALTSALTTLGSIGRLLVTNIDAATSSRSTVTTAQVNTEADQALADVGLTATITGRIDVATSTRLASASYTVPPTAIENADGLLDRANAIEVGATPRQSLRLMLAALAGKLSGAATATVTIRNAVADSKPRITATVDSDGNRTAVTTDVS